MKPNDTIALSDAAYQLRVPYQKALSLMLTGEITGSRDSDGRRWRITTESVAQYLERTGAVRRVGA